MKVQQKTSWKRISILTFLCLIPISGILYYQSPDRESPVFQEGITETTIFLSSETKDNQEGKVNRLAHTRNLNSLHKLWGENPHEITFQSSNKPDNYRATEFSPETSTFPPLLSIKTSGVPGEITLQGDLYTLPVKQSTGPNPETIYIHPEYNWKQDNLSEMETLTLTFKDKEGRSSNQEILIEWSKENQMFLADNCLPHLAALADTKANPILRININRLNPNREEIFKWIEDTAESLKGYNFDYEELPNGISDKNGWQTIRNPQEILSQRKGNCLDLSIFWAGLMLGQNLQTWIIVLPEHALVAVGPLGSSSEEAIPLETTILTGKTTGREYARKAVEQGHKRVLDELKNNPEGIKIIDINYWHQFFQENETK